MNKHTRFLKARRWLLFWTLFIGLGAVAGSFGMIADPSGKAMGMDAMLPYFQILPFANILFVNFKFSGYALLVVNGLTNLTAAGLLLAKKKIGIVLGSVFGVTLMLWIIIQFYIFPLNFMSTIYFFFGLAQAVTGYVTFVFHEQEMFSFCETDYPNIGKNPSCLVVFYSRDGYTKKIAYEEANKTGANVLCISTDEKTSGFTGFMWCGRFGMHRWCMKINLSNVNLEAYEHVLICSPIWVFSLSAPMRSFCKQASGKLKNASLITVHFTEGKYLNAKSEVEKLTQIKMSSYKSICCRFGKVMRIVTANSTKTVGCP